MKIVVYSKEDCGICESAKDKLKIMKLPFEIRDFDTIGLVVEGWRTNGAVDALAYSTLNGGMAPIILIDGVAHNYSGAMSALKRAKRETKS